MNAQKLQQQSLKPGTDSVLIRCLDNGVLIGHAFATRWDAEEEKSVLGDAAMCSSLAQASQHCYCSKCSPYPADNCSRLHALLKPPPSLSTVSHFALPQ